MVSGHETAATLLRRLRREQGRTLRGASTELGLAASYLSRIERGERRPTSETSARIARFYGVSPEILALAEGVVPQDVIVILQENPHELDRLRRRYRCHDSNNKVPSG
jgi:transcriptional regulator with XRE-family HTH domain